jgi:protein-tyrosine phosphatase
VVLTAPAARSERHARPLAAGRYGRRVTIALDFTTIPNFRDTGGVRTGDGHRVRTGLLYRSVALDAASDADLRTLSDLGIRTVFDLRTALEQERRPDRLPRGAQRVGLDLLIDSGEADPAALFALMEHPRRASAELRDGGSHRFYVATYHDLVRLPSARAGYARFLRTLADPTARPALVHCTTGKDRTGWAVATLLLLLGVSEEDVMAEYMLSDREVRRAFEHVVDAFVARGGLREVIEPLMSVQPAFLEAALEAVRAEYGSIEAYVGDGLGLDATTRTELRSAFLE